MSNKKVKLLKVGKLQIAYWTGDVWLCKYIMAGHECSASLSAVQPLSLPPCPALSPPWSFLVQSPLTESNLPWLTSIRPYMASCSSGLCFFSYTCCEKRSVDTVFITKWSCFYYGCATHRRWWRLLSSLQMGHLRGSEGCEARDLVHGLQLLD